MFCRHLHFLILLRLHGVELDDEDAEGPLLLTSAILKNRGLTRHRSKSVRNPRVKKRQKFAKAKKVIASQKPVFNFGAGDSTWYGGERTGLDSCKERAVLNRALRTRLHDVCLRTQQWCASKPCTVFPIEKSWRLQTAVWNLVWNNHG